MYEQLPLWTGFFEKCGFEVVLSDKSSRELYLFLTRESGRRYFASERFNVRAVFPRLLGSM